MMLHTSINLAVLHIIRVVVLKSRIKSVRKVLCMYPYLGR